MELADSFPVEHGVEGGDFVDVHLVDLGYFGYFPHGGEGEEVVVLFLCEGEEGDDGRPLPVGGIFREDAGDLLVVGRGEVEGGGVVVLLVLAMREVAS